MINQKEIYEILMKNFVSDKESEWVEVSIVSTMLHINIVSQVFQEIDHARREEKVESFIVLPTPYTKGFWTLLTPEEALIVGLERTREVPIERVHSWSDLVDYYRNQKVITLAETDPIANRSKVISFYSYKGGVGRTTALAHVAYLLAQAGKKVVIVDLDIEAPGFLNIFSKDTYDEPKNGLVDYFYDRITKTEKMEKEVLITDVFAELKFSDISGRLFMVPAGQMSIDYIEKSDFIKAKLVSGYRKDYWAEFVDDLTSQLTPDYILVDTRTGINEWGAFSLLMVSDSSYFFVYPNEENYLGTKTILQAINEVGYKNYTIIFSKVPAIKEGKEKMVKYWQGILNCVGEDDPTMRLPEPISTTYSTDLALVDGYPSELIHEFRPIADSILEEEKTETVKKLFKDSDQLTILDSLLETVDATFTLPEHFQEPMFLQKYFGDEVSIILGPPGAGKTTLCEMTINYKWNLGTKEEVIPLWAFHDRDAEMLNCILAKNEEYSAQVWVANILRNIYLQKDSHSFIQQYINELKLNNLPENPGGVYLEEMNDANETHLSDSWKLLHKQLVEDNKKLWLLFDGVFDVLDDPHYLTGLLNWVIVNRFSNIRYKLFFDKIDWSRLEYRGKEHFNGKIIEILWNKGDFISMVLKYLIQSNCYSGAPIDDDIRLHMFWGLRSKDTKYSKKMTDWIFDMLKDAQQGTYPGTVKVFLSEALRYQKRDDPREKSARSTLSIEAVRHGLYTASRARWNVIVNHHPDLQNGVDTLAAISENGFFKLSDFIKLIGDVDRSVEILKNLESLAVISLCSDGSHNRKNTEMQYVISGLYQGVFKFADKGETSKG